MNAYKKNNAIMIAVFTLPALAAVLLVFAYPVTRTILMSFFRIENLISSMDEWQFVGFGNFTELMTTSLFRLTLVHTLQIWLFGGIAITIISITLAVILTSGIRFKSFFRAAIYLPNIISAVALANMWIHYAFNVRWGLFHSIFKALGMEKMAGFQWTSPDYVFLSMMIAFCFGSVGYYMLIYISGIEKIPVDIYESAKIEGSSVVHSFFTLTLPLLRSVFKTTMTIWTINSLGFYVWSMMFSSGKDASAEVLTPVYYMIRTVFGEANTSEQRINAGSGAAICVIIMILAVIMFTIIDRVFKDDDITF